MVRGTRRTGPSRRSDALKRSQTVADTLLIGIASIDITPPVGILLAGYRDRVSTSIGHEIRAEALVCQQGETRWALVIAETLGFPASFVAAVRQAISARCGIPGTHILITTTHTHSAPVTHAETLAPHSREARHRATLLTKLSAVVAKAARGAKPGTLETAQCSAPQWGHNRRVQRSDGTWTNVWEDRQRAHTGYFDPSIQLLGVRRPDGMLDALLINYGCHPVTLGPQSLAISGDYVSYLKDTLEERGVARTVLFGIAGHANINPPFCIRRSASHAQRMGRSLARIVGAAIPTLRPVTGMALGAATRAWHLPREGMGRSKKLTSEIMALRAGKVAIVGVPGELFSEYVAHFRASSPCAHTIVLSFANGYIGYFPTDAAAEEGAYEARAAPAKRLEMPLRDLVARTLVQACRPNPVAAGKRRVSRPS